MLSLFFYAAKIENFEKNNNILFNTVRLSPPRFKFGGARLVKVPQDWGI